MGTAVAATADRLVTGSGSGTGGEPTTAATAGKKHSSKGKRGKRGPRGLQGVAGAPGPSAPPGAQGPAGAGGAGGSSGVEGASMLVSIKSNLGLSDFFIVPGGSGPEAAAFTEAGAQVPVPPLAAGSLHARGLAARITTQNMSGFTGGPITLTLALDGAATDVSCTVSPPAGSFADATCTDTGDAALPAGGLIDIRAPATPGDTWGMRLSLSLQSTSP
jgi:hypothetical protein